MLYRLAIRYQGEIIDAKVEKFATSEQALKEGGNWFKEKIGQIRAVVGKKIAESAFDLRVSFVEEQLDMFATTPAYEVSSARLGD